MRDSKGIAEFRSDEPLDKKLCINLLKILTS